MGLEHRGRGIPAGRDWRYCLLHGLGHSLRGGQGNEGYLGDGSSYTVVNDVVYVGSVGGPDYSGGMYAFTAPLAGD